MVSCVLWSKKYGRYPDAYKKEMGGIGNIELITLFWKEHYDVSSFVL